MATTAIKLHNAGTGTSSEDKRVGINWDATSATPPSYNLDVNGTFGINNPIYVITDVAAALSYKCVATSPTNARAIYFDNFATNTGVSPMGISLQISGNGNRGIIDRSSTLDTSGTTITLGGDGKWIIFKDSSNRVRIPQSLYATNVGSYYQASGSTTSATQLTSLNTITQVTLVTNGPNGIISSDIESNYTISSGGIKVAQGGTYRITGSIHMTNATMTDAYRKQIFVRRGTDFSSATEVMQATDIISTSIATPGALTLGPKIVTASANDIFFLACRFSQPSTSTTTIHGSFYSGNSATYLLVERVS